MRADELVDAFDAANPALTYHGPATRDAGRLRLPMVEGWRTNPETGEPLTPAGITSTELLDLTESGVVLELVSAPVTSLSQVVFTLYNPDSTAGFAAWVVEAGVLRATRYVDQLESVGYSAPYDPQAHRWLCIRHERGAVVWSTSVDGLDWTDRAVLLVPFPVTGLRLEVSTLLREAANPEDDDGLAAAPALVDNLNAPPLPAGIDPFTSIGGHESAPNLAIDVLPSVGGPGTFTLDQSELDGLDVLGWGSGRSWQNVVCDVRTVQIERGLGEQLGTVAVAQVGTCSLLIVDTERRFDPTTNGEAIHPRTPIRVRAWAGTDSQHPDWSEVLFTGAINGDGIAVDYARTGAPLVTINASDLVGTFARWRSTGHPEPGAGAGDDLLERLVRILADVGLDEGTIAVGSDPHYTATLAPSRIEAALPAIEEAAQAELGRVWVTARNRVAVRARGSELAGPVRGTLSDWHGESIDDPEVHCCYVDPAVRFAPDQLVNRAVASRRGSDAEPVQLDDEGSQARYDVIAETATGLALATDEQVRPWARALVLAASEPRVRVDRVSPTPWGAPEAWQAVLATDVGDRWHFRLHPEIGGAVRVAVGVLGVVHDITPESWSIVWRTTRAPAPGENVSGWFTLDVSTLDGGDVLAPFA